KLAARADHAVFGAFLDLLGGEAVEDGPDLLARAGALVHHVGALVDAHAMLVEQPVEQTLGTDGGVEKLVRLHGRHQRKRLLPGVVLRMAIARILLVTIAARQISHAAALGRFRQKLDQQAAGAPALGAAVLTRHDDARDTKAHLSRYLLRLAEIGAR